MSRNSRERVAQNFVDRFGVEGLRWLIDALGNGESGQAIADHFDVSRERVRQWKNTFGTVMTIYHVHPEVQALMVAAPEPEPIRVSSGGGAGVYLVEDG